MFGQCLSMFRQCFEPNTHHTRASMFVDVCRCVISMCRRCVSMCRRCVSMCIDVYDLSINVYQCVVNVYRCVVDVYRCAARPARVITPVGLNREPIFLA